MSNLLSRKLERLRLVPTKYKLKTVVYLLQRAFGLQFNNDIDALNTFITTHLERYNGHLVEMDAFTFTSHFFNDSFLSHRITLRKLPSSDLKVYKQVFEFLEYAPLVELIKENEIGSSLNIIDAGGNIGSTSIYLQKYFPDSTFIIVEPDDSNLKILKKNILLNDFKNCKIIEGGVWYRDTFLEISRDFRDKSDWAIRVNESDKDTDLKGYSICTLMRFMDFESIDILKIDIEGSEKMLFEDENSVSTFLPRTRFIAIEVHDEFNCREIVLERLATFGFEVRHEGESIFGVNRSLITNG